jgi:glycine betaine catabolism B
MIIRHIKRASMYRLALYYLIGLLAMSAIYGLFGWIAEKPLSILETAAGLLVATIAADFALSKLFGVWTDHESAAITALILALIAGPASLTSESARFAAIASSGAFAMAAKYLLAYKRQHLFNPAAVGIFLSSIVFKEYASWWVGQPVLLPAVALGGILLVWKVRRFKLVGVFLGAFAAMVFGSALFQGMPIDSALRNIGFVFFHTEALFLAAVMLTEPKTSPKNFAAEAAYAVIVAFFMIPQLSILSINSSPELALMAANVFAFFASPKGRHLLTLKEKKELGNGLSSFTFDLPRGFRHEPGQYADFALPLRPGDGRGARRAFSIASSPTEGEILIAARFPEEPSDYKSALAAMRPGDAILATEVSGEFLLPRDPGEKLAFVAGGVGITPIRSMVKYMIDKGERRDAVLLCSIRSEEDIAFSEVFREATGSIGLKAAYTLTGTSGGSAAWKGERGRIDAAMLRRSIEDPRARTFLVSGSPSFVAHVRRELRSIGVRSSRIRTDPFQGY